MTPRYVSAEEALKCVRSGHHVLVGSGASEPQVLVRALAAKGEHLSHTEVLHLLTLGAAPYADARFEGKLRHNALFIGPNVRPAVQRGLADYTPCFLSEVPGLIRAGRLPVDVALISVSPPEGGVCSLGVSVDILRAAVEEADIVIAQVNARMPWTLGNSFIKEDDIDYFVMGDEALPELPHPETDQAAWHIGRYVSQLINDGDTLQLGIGEIPDAVLALLTNKKDLGIHSEMISDGVLDLWRKGVINGARKSLDPGKIVASFAMGSRALYDALDRNPTFEFYPSDYVNNPCVIALNERMVAVNSALQVDLTGQVCADSLGSRFYSGFGGQVDFIRGAAWSKGGRSIIALPSTAKNGSVSRVAITLTEGAGVVTTRADVDYIVTEYGIASLKGRTIRERAVALIQIAHPDHRAALVEGANRLGYLDHGHVLPQMEEAYRVDLEANIRFGPTQVFFRPLKPSDERRLKDLFYSQSPETTYRRFGMALKCLSEKQFQDLVAVDYRRTMAIAGFVREGHRQRMIAVGRYIVGSDSTQAEAAFAVHDDYQGKGVGTFLVDYLAWIALQQGLEGFTAEVMSINEHMRHIFENRFRGVHANPVDGTIMVSMRLEDWKGAGNPAARGLVSA
jgi:acyl-CoA hydrolase